ncbi:MAG: hypothetical protein H7318_14190 [Oligoflexus sp.]|nr:hypothetical protein [Oligoflexus sp.]
MEENTNKTEKRARKNANKEARAEAAEKARVAEAMKKPLKGAKFVKIGGAQVDRSSCASPACIQIGATPRFCANHKTTVPKEDKAGAKNAQKKAFRAYPRGVGVKGLLWTSHALTNTVVGGPRIQWKSTMTDQEFGMFLVQETFNILSGRYALNVIDKILEQATKSISLAEEILSVVISNTVGVESSAAKHFYGKPENVKKAMQSVSFCGPAFIAGGGKLDSPQMKVAMFKAVKEFKGTLTEKDKQELAGLIEEREEAVREASVAKDAVERMMDIKDEDSVEASLIETAKVAEKKAEEKSLAVESKKDSINAEQEAAAKALAEIQALVSGEQKKVNTIFDELKHKLFNLSSKGFTIKGSDSACIPPFCSDGVGANGKARVCGAHK